MTEQEASSGEKNKNMTDDSLAPHLEKILHVSSSTQNKNLTFNVKSRDVFLKCSGNVERTLEKSWKYSVMRKYHSVVTNKPPIVGAEPPQRAVETAGNQTCEPTWA